MANQFSSRQYSFLIETSATPIYQRIVTAFVDTLRQLGHQVHLINAWQYSSELDYLKEISGLDLDFCLITNSLVRLLSYSEQKSGFLYEFVKCPLIFIHHDSLFSYLLDAPDKLEQEHMVKRLQELHKRKDKDWHFCLEYYNFLDLRALGFNQAYQIYHASEFQNLGVSNSYKYDVSFVGHVISGENQPMEHCSFIHWLKADYWNRILKLDYKVENSANTFATKQTSDSDNILNFIPEKYFYIGALHAYSMYLRSEIIKGVKNFPVDIIGGDPGYLNKKSSQRLIEQPNINYQPAVMNYSETREIYAKSKINLNITSLQFDTAVINRVIDVGAVGGFILTDWKEDLGKLTSVSEEISYKTIEELNYKLEYYLHPDHEQERQEIAATFYQDIRQKCSYLTVVQQILEKLSMEQNLSENLKIDLGCGRYKAKDFIGVDVYPGPGIDLVANLNKRFPFPDNSAEVIRAYDVIEHLEDRIHTMNEIWRVCKPGAIVDLLVPSTDGRGAFQDPTHISFWNINSFKYYCVEYPSYLELNQIYGFKGAFSIVNLEHQISPDEVVHVRAVLKVLKDFKQNSLEQLLPEITLKQFNVVVFPDWQQAEDLLAEDLMELLCWVISFQPQERLSLLIDIQQLEPDEANLLISGVLMELLMREELAESDFTAEVNLISNLSQQQWEVLSARMSGQFVLQHQSLPENYKIFAEKIPLVQKSAT